MDFTNVMSDFGLELALFGFFAGVEVGCVEAEGAVEGGGGASGGDGSVVGGEKGGGGEEGGEEKGEVELHGFILCVLMFQLLVYEMG